MLFMTISIPLFLKGQSKTIDSTSENFVVKDTVIIENILASPDVEVEKPSKNASARPVIPMPIPEMTQFDLRLPPKYRRYEDIENMFRYTGEKFDPWKVTLNLNLPPQKTILDLIRENPLKALGYGVAALAGMANHNLVGEDKMNIIRLNNMVQSRSGIPETAISGWGTVYYEIDLKTHK
jgi:hypothetical protein